ncbi:phosphoribosylformylglycinamidine cyclo-ligase [Pseudobacillus badius]|uniref:phosphoribosylformylglycinamidine cyclo-ligase n=1 Tax=Bacillus badius TaxID=1455 RepID=UPI0007B07267|nr:phosphoribosylformylglycinamidine cyclo-ligase [Bacillus badius]KZO01275.1 phosphoribosylformylglycinamidine cyclo-ligase [Bacillus badius]OCS89513.1 phosphoribosylformylglycinamidine cyclo-ligase [Bacillus badius]OVE49939.1 phosphoribosylformylglycinamidine cyclo-ligase [Bacillus badius]TDW01082.1 phosphoribosylformylglycinamidine cyclo-ligase [Bacillus badius]UAT31112.1 phosphoribosylformylglycinamidine cyclo-ligase [Bacillus badius]
MAKSYEAAGVNIEAGYEAVERMKKHVKRTNRAGVMGTLGSFGGMFDLSAAGVKEPVLVSGTDGVGTKLKLAFMMDRHDTIGIDCVAMCVNDVIVQGAEPLYFLDYIACGQALPEKIEQIVKGVADGCEQAGCALVGGETAEMPGMYNDGEYDIAGFTTGVAEKSKLITGETIEAGDVLIGLPSSGVHSNGFSLVRKIFFEQHGLKPDAELEELSAPLGDVLLTPTKIYVKPVLEVLKQMEVKGMAHITGGGFIENVPRALPEGLGAVITEGAWEVPEIFEALKVYGELDTKEMYNIFNMGIGLVMIVSAEEEEQAKQLIAKAGEKAYTIGRVISGEGVQFES